MVYVYMVSFTTYSTLLEDTSNIRNNEYSHYKNILRTTWILFFVIFILVGFLFRNQIMSLMKYTKYNNIPENNYYY